MEGCDISTVFYPVAVIRFSAQCTKFSSTEKFLNQSVSEPAKWKSNPAAPSFRIKITKLLYPTCFTNLNYRLAETPKYWNVEFQHDT